jgi:hypothetical protein
MRRALTTLAVLLALAPPAAAAPQRLGTSLTRPLVDAATGRVVWQPERGSVRVLDLGAQEPARPVAIPAGCRSGQAGALRGDRLVLGCPDGQRLLDVAGGSVGPVPGAEQAGIGAPETGVLTVGRVWGEGFVRDAAVFFRLDGSTVEAGDGPATALPDLDSNRLWRPICAPLARTPDPDRFRGYLPYAYSPPLAVDHRPFPYRPLRVDRCGRERQLRLSRCKRACVAVNLGAGSVAWRERGRIRLYRGKSGRRASWPTTAFGRQAVPMPTRARVIVTAGRQGAYSLWSVRAPT